MTTESVRRDVEVEREAKRRVETNLEVKRKKCEGTLGILRMPNLDVYSDGILARPHNLPFGNPLDVVLDVGRPLKARRQTGIQRTASSQSPSGEAVWDDVLLFTQMGSPRTSKNQARRRLVSIQLTRSHVLHDL